MTPSSAKLIRERLCARHLKSVRGFHAVGIGRDRVRQSGIPQKPALCVMDEIAIVGQLDRHADIDARATSATDPARRVAAVEDVELVDTRGRSRP